MPGMPGVKFAVFGPPVVGSTMGLPRFVFEDAPSVDWIDPPLASGFTYSMTGSSLFTAVLDLLSGFNPSRSCSASRASEPARRTA